MKLAIGFLIFLAAVVVNAVPILEELVLAVEEDTDQIRSRESRSINALGVPWHLDRIDQQGPLLDGKYKPFRKGKTFLHTYKSVCVRACMHPCMCK